MQIEGTVTTLFQDIKAETELSWTSVNLVGQTSSQFLDLLCKYS